MIPTLIAFGLILGLIPALRLPYKIGATALAAAAWAAYVAFGVAGSAGSVALGFVLAVLNTVTGVAIGMGIVAIIHLSRSHTVRATH